MNQRLTKFEDILSPGRLLFRLTAAVFLTELVVMFVLFNLWNPHLNNLAREFLDSFALAILILPFLWWWIIRPLGSSALYEKLLAANVIDNSVDAIITTDDQGTIVGFNLGAERLFGYTREEAIGKNVKIIIPKPEREQHDTYIKRYLSTGQQKILGTSREVSGEHKDGMIIPLYLSVSETRVASRRMFTGIMHDLTARNRDQEQLRLQGAALESAANAILITDVSGKILWANQAFTESTGYSQAEVAGRNPRLLKSGKQQRAFYEEMWSTILAGKVWRNTLINRRKDGSLAHEDMTITPIHDQIGKITHFVAIKQDITQLEQALAELQTKKDELTAMTQQLWQASKLATMGELSASIAHELNNPLATVALRVEALSTQLEADEQKRRSLEIVSQEVDRMARLVDNLLQFSRRSHRQISTVDVRNEIGNSVDFIQYHLRSHNIEVKLELDESLPTIQADRQQLRQLFLNLLTNAADAMPALGAISIRAMPGSLDGVEAVAIDFIDTGEGIPAANLEKIWEPFFTTKAEGKGTGLGLAICRRIVEEHGGIIQIESVQGNGTTVRVVFPATTKEPAMEL